jgi:putative flippase GtrA
MSRVHFLTLVRFSFVGLITAVIYYAMLAAGVEWLELNPALSSSIAYPVVVTFNYLMHFHWTYDAAGAHSTVAGRYLLMVVCGFLINGAIMWSGVTLLQLNYLIIQALAMAVVIAFNFLLSSFWVFRQ